MRLSGSFGPKRLAPAKQIFRHRQRPVHVFSRERLHQAAEREIRHREARRLAAHEKARNSKIVQANGNRKAGGSMGEVKIEKDEVRIMLLGRGDRRVRIVRHGDHAIPRIVLDQIFERNCQLGIVFDDQNPKHLRALPEAAEILIGFSRIDARSERFQCESPVNKIYAKRNLSCAETKKAPRNRSPERLLCTQFFRLIRTRRRCARRSVRLPGDCGAMLARHNWRDTKARSCRRSGRCSQRQARRLLRPCAMRRN